VFFFPFCIEFLVLNFSSCCSDLLQPAWDERVLAPDTTHQQAYPNTMLCIYGKEWIFMPSCLVKLADMPNVSVTLPLLMFFNI
jgi:hypothetical protein